MPDTVLTFRIFPVAVQIRRNQGPDPVEAVVCVLGGCVFLVPGTLAGLEFFSVSISGGSK